MNVETQAVAAKPKPADIEHHRLIGVEFHKTLVLWSESGVSTAKGYSIVPAKLTSTLDWRETKPDEAPTGVGLTRISKTPQGGRVVQRCYVPMSNICEFKYGE